MSGLVPLSPNVLYRRCSPSDLPFETTAEVAETTSIVGQERAIAAVEFGIGIDREGYNLFVLGSPGTGKHTLLREFLERRAAREHQPPDWCYVYNFEQPHKPIALRLPPGQGLKLKTDMAQFVEELRGAIPTAFDSDEYRARVEQIDSEYRERETQAFQEIGQESSKQHIALLRTPAGFSFAPMKGDGVMEPEEFNQLPVSEQEKFGKDIGQFQEKLERAVHQVHRWHAERRERIRELNREMVSYSAGHLVDELKVRYGSEPTVLSYLEAVRNDVVEHAEDFRKPTEAVFNVPGLQAPETVNVRRYEVNLLVAHNEADGAPLVSEDHPIYQNLMGRIEHIAQFGTMVTDFTLIKPGALHLANGGYLLLDVYKLLTQPFSWEGLKRALSSGSIRIESLGQMYSLVSTVSLEPEPIPLNAKVVLFGDRLAYYLLSAYDPEFEKLFKVAVDFEDDIPRNAESTVQFAQSLAAIVRKEKLLPFDRSGIARLIEHCSRLAEDAEKLSMHLQRIVDLMREADYWAQQAQHDEVTEQDVQTAIDNQIRRVDRIRNRAQEAILRDIMLIDTRGEMVGQINGLSVVMLGNYAFAHPTRITATTRLGDGDIVDIHREVALGGAIHSKGVMTLGSFLATRYSRKRPLSLSASLTFEQTYGPVEGDSASLAELCALLSSLADAPIKQSLAVTGSVNQRGQVQAIGGVNEKIEGFFDICRKRELNGEQGVLIPEANVKHLMLRRDVVDAVAAKKFHIFAISNVDEAIELLTGIAAGEPNAAGDVPKGSINYRVAIRLYELAVLRQGFGETQKQPKTRRNRVRSHR